MSDFTGAGLYRIESVLDREVRCSQKAGADKKIVTWKAEKDHNDVWAFAYAGISKAGKDEYHIINNKSGMFLTYPDGAPQGKQLEVAVISPTDMRCRWSVTPLRNRTGQYWITPAANQGMYLNINNRNTKDGTEIWLYSQSSEISCKWYLAQAWDERGAGVPFNSPDLGPAAA